MLSNLAVLHGDIFIWEKNVQMGRKNPEQMNKNWNINASVSKFRDTLEEGKGKTKLSKSWKEYWLKSLFKYFCCLINIVIAKKSHEGLHVVTQLLERSPFCGWWGFDPRSRQTYIVKTGSVPCHSRCETFTAQCYFDTLIHFWLCTQNVMPTWILVFNELLNEIDNDKVNHVSIIIIKELNFF